MAAEKTAVAKPAPAVKAAPAQAKPTQAKAAGEEIRQKIRIAEVNVDGNQPIYKALRTVKGLGVQMARAVAIRYAEENNTSYDRVIGELSDEEVAKIEHIIRNPTSHKIPSFLVNQRKEYVTGADTHLVMTGLDLNTRNTIKRLQETRSYRGLRHSWGLTVRGQGTKATGRKFGKKARYRANKRPAKKKD